MLDIILKIANLLKEEKSNLNDNQIRYTILDNTSHFSEETLYLIFHKRYIRKLQSYSDRNICTSRSANLIQTRIRYKIKYQHKRCIPGALLL